MREAWGTRGAHAAARRRAQEGGLSLKRNPGDGSGRMRMHALPPLRRLSCLVSCSSVRPLSGEADGFGKGFGLLVSLGCGRRRPCTCDLSTSSSPTALQKWTSYL